ncbi:MAG: cytochrome c biogenesis protein CcsA, partial [Myxococcota bacterium]
YAPLETTMGIVQKVFYVHVPSAIAMYAGFVLCAAASFSYLLKPNRVVDAAASASAEVGMVFGVFVMISGPMWAYKAWGKPWVWDAQLTASLILFLLFGSYVLLRRFGADSASVRKISAVLAIIAAMDIPVIRYAIKNWQGMHPSGTVTRGEGRGLAEAAMQHTFGVAMLSFMLLFIVMFWVHFRQRVLAWNIDRLHRDLSRKPA